MPYESLLVERSGGIATFTLDRPHKLNAYTSEMGAELTEAFREARDDDAVRVVILTGAGRAFCAGVDLEVLRSGGEAARAKLAAGEFIREMPLELAQYPKPTIAAINGAAIGVGVTMVLPLDIRIAAEEAKLGLTFTQLGLLPGLGSSHLLPELVGRAKALELVLASSVIGGPEALEIGLVNRTAPAERVLEVARELAQTMADCDPAVLAHAKQSLRYGSGASLAEALANEPVVQQSLRRGKQS